ncbi:hypothetical protein MFIFM68171_02076 [Madurella fahalii]|uniref:Uncharacterized protein n=1 Tax=Madurella fahalii TaxID=1157608 RepID=A0ABQ0G281_9PEZI
MEITKEEEVHSAYRSLKRARKEGKTIPIDSLVDPQFILLCSDHVDHLYSDIYPTKRVDFYHLDDEDNSHLDRAKLSSETDMLYGLVYLDSDASCHFGPFRPPTHASRKAIKMKDSNGTYELSFKFLGNGYLKLRVPRELVFKGRYGANPPAPQPTPPEVFEFVGIWRDTEKEKAEEQEIKSETPSFRETWFEMNHPMGAWKQAGHPPLLVNGGLLGEGDPGETSEVGDAAYPSGWTLSKPWTEAVAG